MNEGVLSAEQDGGDQLLVRQRGDLVVAGQRVHLRHLRVDSAGVHPLGLGAPSTAVAAVHRPGQGRVC